MIIHIGLIKVMKIIGRICDVLLCALLKSLLVMGRKGSQSGLSIMWKRTPLIDAKNATNGSLLDSNLAGASRAFRQVQQRVKKVVDRAKDNCILSAAKEAEKAVKDGRTRKCIRRLQQAHVGHRPCIPRAVWKEDGELTGGPSEVLRRWSQHFSNLLNQQSSFVEEVIQQIPTVPP